MPPLRGTRDPRALALLMALLAAGTAAAQGSRGLLVSPQDLAPRLNAPDLLLLHAGDRLSDFETGHLPGARFARYREFAVDGPDGLASELPPAADLAALFARWGVTDGSDVVIYGSSPVAAARLFFTLDAVGHPRVRVLDGGLRAWRDAGGTVETGPEGARPPRADRFEPRLDRDRLATAEWIRQQLPSGGIALVDVRPDDEFTGADGGHGGAHVAGHISGASQLPWGRLVGADGRFLPDEALRLRLEAAGVSPGKPVVSYCMIGMRASVVYFVLRHLGFDARLYDGSIVDWGRRGLPTVRTGEAR